VKRENNNNNKFKKILISIFLISIFIIFIFFLLNFEFIKHNFKDKNNLLFCQNNKNQSCILNSNILNDNDDINKNSKSINNIDNMDILKNNENTINIVEFIDFNSKFSKIYYKNIHKKILNDFKKNVNINIISLPNVENENSIITALLYECSKEEDKSNLVYNYLLEKKIYFNQNQIKEISNKLNLNYTNINNCINQKKYSYVLEKNILIAKKFKIIKSPTIIINQRIIKNIPPYYFIKKEIEYNFKKIKKNNNSYNNSKI